MAEGSGLAVDGDEVGHCELLYAEGRLQAEPGEEVAEVGLAHAETGRERIEDCFAAAMRFQHQQALS